MLNNNPIAILLAVYNGEKYLSEQLDSLVYQTNHFWTLYIRDDSSNDKTLEIINQYTKKYDNIILISDKLGNLGCRNNFFYLLESVTSDYYMFCDSDDYWYPDKVEITYKRMREIEKTNPGLPILVHTDCEVCDENMNTLAVSYWKSINLNPENFLTIEEFPICTCVGGARIMINNYVKDLIYPLKNNSIMHDAWITLNVIQNGIISTIHKPTMKYRQHNYNVRGINSKNKHSFFKILEDNSNYYSKLKQIGYGSFFKYVYYKLKIIIKLKTSNYNR